MRKHPKPDLNTTDGVTLRRILAFFVDGVLIGVLGVPFILLGPVAGDLITLLFLSVYVLVGLIYALLLEGLLGYTPGKYLFGLVVVKSDGSQCTIPASMLRNLAWIIDALPTLNLVAMISIYLTDKDQRVGDLVADTIVAKQR
ncbi:RDD family protein [Halonotius pteroides]|uniref:RDD family protein n=1 Tax=Halonotius pteroides TaxID=268735 RepID=A0A3A6QM51_9EURY|nr:RDD family protein [Halonotius pteroides]RJX49037.1 RDD family protein [Halonotius pteroides]